MQGGRHENRQEGRGREKWTQDHVVGGAEGRREIDSHKEEERGKEGDKWKQGRREVRAERE